MAAAESLNCATWALSSSAWAARLWAVELSSSVWAAFCWVTVSIWVTALFTCSIPWACSAEAAVISAIEVGHLLDPAHDLGEGAARLVDELGPVLHLGHAVGDQGLDLLGGGRTPLGQGPDLTGHHREAPPLLPGSGGFHRGVQGQEVGLEGDLVVPGANLGFAVLCACIVPPPSRKLFTPCRGVISRSMKPMRPCVRPEDRLVCTSHRVVLVGRPGTLGKKSAPSSSLTWRYTSQNRQVSSFRAAVPWISPLQ